MSRLPAFLLPLALLASTAGGQTLQEKRFGPPAPGDTLPKVVSRDFELYGPTLEDVRKANGEIRLAVSQFENYLGEHPKKVAFVLFRSAAEASRYDPKPLTRHGLEIVPWILPASAPGTGAPQPGADADPNLEHYAGHRFLVAYVVHALAEAGKKGADGAEAPGATGGATSGAGPGIAVPALHPDIPELPDWLEEAIAALCERPALQTRRMDFMRAHLDQRIPLAELFEMRRPGGATQGKAGKPAGSAPAPKAGTAAGVPDRATLFTPEALSVARFIARREQDRFIGTIVEGVLRGRTVSDVINTSQDLFSKPEALEKQWLEWMQSSAQGP